MAERPDHVIPDSDISSIVGNAHHRYYNDAAFHKFVCRIAAWLDEMNQEMPLIAFGPTDLMDAALVMRQVLEDKRRRDHMRENPGQVLQMPVNLSGQLGDIVQQAFHDGHWRFGLLREE